MHYCHSKGLRNIVSPNSISFAIDKFDIIDCEAQPYISSIRKLWFQTPKMIAVVATSGFSKTLDRWKWDLSVTINDSEQENIQRLQTGIENRCCLRTGFKFSTALSYVQQCHMCTVETAQSIASQRKIISVVAVIL